MISPTPSLRLIYYFPLFLKLLGLEEKVPNDTFFVGEDTIRAA
jgi:hypothetical protein